MATTVKFDFVGDAKVKDTLTGVQIVRGAMVSGIDIVEGETGTDPSVLLKALAPPVPLLGTSYPDDEWAICRLTERNVVNIASKTQAMLELVYSSPPRGSGGGGGEPVWTITDACNPTQIETYGTSRGTKSTDVWYKTGAAATFGAAPADSVTKTGKVRKYIANRIIRATAIIRGDVWSALQAGIRGVGDSINETPWYGRPRGWWYFPGPISTTRDYGQTYSLELIFIEGKHGHFPLVAYFNLYGDHPKDSVTEAVLRGHAPGVPANDDVFQGNGLTIASVQDEADWSTVFPFGV